MGKIRSAVAWFLRLVRSESARLTGRVQMVLPTFSERLEQRVYMAFTASMSAPQSVNVNQAYTVSLSTTGGASIKWVVNWGDGLPSITYLPPTGQTVFGVQFQPPSHPYFNTGQNTITATAYLTANVTAVAAMTLASNFGTQNFQGSGKTVFTPVGSSGDSKGQAMAVDHSGSTLDGYIYVASNYNDGVHGGQMAVTRFNPQGVIDYTWGAQGTVVIPKFATGTDTDTPAAINITIDGSQLVVVGTSSAAGWAVASITVGSGTILWQNTLVSGSSIAGQANALTLGDSDSETHVTVVGTNATQTHMVAAQFNASNGTLNTAFGDPDGLGGKTGKVVIPNTIPGTSNILVGNAVANAVIEPDLLTALDEGLIIGGSESYCLNANSYATSDMVLIALNPDGSYFTSFGSSGIAAVNIGNNGGGGQSCGANLPSFDSDYSLIETFNPVTSAGQVTAVGSSYQSVNGVGYASKFAVERFNLSNGALDTAGFGPLVSNSTTLHYGFAFGPNGIAYAAALDNTSTHNDNTIVAVGSGANNFLAARFNSDGTLDNTFGTNGVVGNTDFGVDNGTANTIDYARSVFIRPDGTILVGGYDYTTGTNGQIALAELLDKNKVSVL